MEKKRILIVDDSALIRKLVSTALERESDIEAIIAPSGAVALAKIERLKPDLVVLDVEMPEMNGLETLARIHAIHPKLPVVMFSALTESGSKIAVEAMALGAADYVLKPTKTAGLDTSLEYVRENLMSKIRMLCRIPAPSPASLPPGKPANVMVPASPGAAVLKTNFPPAKPSPSPTWAASATNPAMPTAARTGASFPPRIPGIIDLVVIGVSTGGPNALAVVVPSFTRDFPVPVLIVQHMPPMFTRLLAERLGTLCGLECKEAADGEIVRAGQLRLAPGNFHMTVTREEKGFRLNLNQNPPENSCRPAVDVLFRSAAACSRNRLLSAVLTGMGQDGMLGAGDIKAEGGIVIAQDEASSVVWGMPGAVVQAGLADTVLPIEDIGLEISQKVRGMRG